LLAAAPATATLKGRMIIALAVASALALFQSTVFAQSSHNVKLHINPKWKQCSFQLDPSLTQAAWHQFTEEAGLVTYFRPLTDANPMGTRRFELSLVQWQTGIDDTDAAWNDTFVHPDSTHWLFEGSGLKFPGLMLRAGLTNRIDVGAYATKSQGGNYGFYGGQVQYNLVHDVKRDWAASTRLSFVSMYGPKDLAFTVYGMDVVASKTYPVFAKWASVSPYAGVSTNLSTSHEKSSAVSLADEHVVGAQGMVGAVAQISMATLAVEYNVAKVQTLSIKVGVSPRF
jgi:hypothetical protein